MTPAIALSFIGIIVSIVFICYATYKGMSIIWASILSALIIMVTSGVDIQESWATNAESMGSMFGTMFPILIFGSTLGMLYLESGAAASLGLALLRPFKNVQNTSVKRIGSIFMFFMLRFLLGLTGIDTMAIISTTVALVIVLSAALDIPRKYCNALLIASSNIGFFMPSVPSMINTLVPKWLPGFYANSATGMRFFICFLFIAGCVLWLDRMIAKAQAQGAHFEMGTKVVVGDLDDPNVRRPHWLLTLIPIIVIYLTYNYLHLQGWSSLLVGLAAASVIFIPFMKLEPKPGQSKFGCVVGKYNNAALMVPLYYMLSYLPGYVMATTSGYQWMSDSLMSASFSPNGALLVYAVICFILVPIGSGAMMINATLASTIFVPMGMSPVAAGVILIVSNTVLNTLPNNPGMIVQADLLETPMKECYPPIFKTTVVLTFAIYVLTVLFCAVGIIA